MTLKKNICFYTQHYLPEMGAPPARISEVAKALVERGHDVSVITAVPNRPHGKIVSGYENKYYYKNIENGIHIHRVKVFLPKYFGSFCGRLITEASFCFFSLFFAFSIIRNSQIVIIQNPPLYSGLIACWVKYLSNTKVISWCSDIWPNLLIELGAIKKNSIIYHFINIIQNINFYYSDAVAVTTPKSTKVIHSAYNIKNKILWRNGVDTEFFQPRDNGINFRKKWGFSNSKFIVGYAGLHGNFQNLNIVLDASKHLIHESPNIHVALVGDGVQKEMLKRRKLMENIENVTFFDSVKRDAMPDLLQSFDAIIVPLARPMPTTIPSKFYESLAAGKPIIVVSDSEITNIVEKYKVGAVYSCGKELSLVGAIQKLSNLDKKLIAKMGENARKLSLKFDRKKIVNKIECDLIKLH